MAEGKIQIVQCDKFIGIDVGCHVVTMGPGEAMLFGADLVIAGAELQKKQFGPDRVEADADGGDDA